MWFFYFFLFVVVIVIKILNRLTQNSNLLQKNKMTKSVEFKNKFKKNLIIEKINLKKLYLIFFCIKI